ncbi:hypothetical protein W97_09114 [Coniosporium apollinis CBS 100218]|uniref:Peroxisomal biogenesis factor 11 n=1 Tax=Coniosporium apollinis (strain CBS 100218) TaxID=1168221 RepID=R7Z7D8_CONA1|nr:uncharacterized protein W97_09114 [Coniosporium apollinis CBS 100218]EON69851.1 hypothetical protein W97_09114 [Coniosporium apollinis CBS 100218]
MAPAAALIYHPTVAHYLRYVATTVGRDKLLRTLQYFSRFYAWYLFRTNASAAAIAPYDAVKKQFGLTRKIMRLGKFVEHLKAAADAGDKKGLDPIIKYCAVGRQLGYAGYMILDNLTVPDAVGIRPMASSKRLLQQAYKCWLAGLLFNVVGGIYQLNLLRQRRTALTLEQEKTGEGVVEVKKLQKERNTLNLQLISDLCDLTVPTFALGYGNLDEGLVGLAGTVSSLIGVYTVWKKTA